MMLLAYIVTFWATGSKKMYAATEKPTAAP
jgi:hypothetical protein